MFRLRNTRLKRHSPIQSTIAATLCVLLGMPSLSAVASTAASATKRAVSRPLDATARARLLVSRLTFGPRSGDLAEVERMGIEHWLDRQLSPQSIDDTALETRLDAYPALRMAQTDRLKRYPEPATLRQFAKTGVLPQNPEARAILADQVEFYELQRQKRSADAQAATMQQASTNASPGTQPKASPATATDAPTANLEQTVQPMARAQMDAILAMSPTDRYGRLLSMPPADLIALRKAARGPQLEGKLVQGMTPLQKETLLALSGTNRMINAETQSARLLRDLYSRRQVEAVMTDFWLNHFNVFSGANGQIPSLLPDYEKAVRAHALGKFEDLLVATAQSPAMLLYLNNSTSMGPDSPAAVRSRRGQKKQDAGLNENYARELMELHTLGVTGGYTQRDVTEVAKVFTGWTLDRPYEGGAYNFNATRHQPGTKTVLGRTIAEGGESEGFEVLHMLATSPATARLISTQIAQRFVGDTPPRAMVDRMTKAFLGSGGDIRTVLRAMVKSPEFFTTATQNAKLKTPLEYVTSAVRVTDAEVENPLPLVQSLQQLGMPLYGCQPPTGYKWDEATWLSSSALINRMNFALALSTNRIAGVSVEWTPALTSSPSVKPAALVPHTPPPDGQGQNFAQDAEKERRLEATLFETPVSKQTRAAVLQQGNDSLAEQAAGQFNSNAGRPRVLTDAEKQAREQDRLDAMVAGRMKGPAPIKGAATERGLGAEPTKMPAPPNDARAAAMAGLLLGSPEFQRR